MTPFFDAASILIREGLEALLVIGAVGAYLTRMGAQARVSALIAGAGMGVVASLITAIAFTLFNNGAHNDLLEGFVMLIAAALLVYISGWLFVRQDPRSWSRYLQDQIGRTEGAGNRAALAGIGFLAVYREGAETALFLNALALQGGWSVALLAGIGAGSGVLVVGFVLVRRLAIRLPLRPIFLISSVLLFVMALRLIAGAVQEFQEQALVPLDEANIPDWLVDLAGNASWEALIPQAILLLIAIASVSWSLVNRRRESAASFRR